MTEGGPKKDAGRRTHSVHRSFLRLPKPSLRTEAFLDRRTLNVGGSVGSSVGGSEGGRHMEEGRKLKGKGRGGEGEPPPL